MRNNHKNDRKDENNFSNWTSNPHADNENHRKPREYSKKQGDFHKDKNRSVEKNHSTQNHSLQNHVLKSRAPKTRRVEFLYEDKEIIAVDKPCGLSVISPENSRAKSLYDYVTVHIQQRNPKGRAALVHRLDRDTSGVMIFAKDARTKKELMSHWNEAVRERKYVALVEGKLPEESGVLDTYLLEENAYRVIEVKPGTRGSLRAITNYKVLKEGKKYSLVELSLETGRRHQIRVQLASVNCPVVGDERYGAKTDVLGRLGLHATVIEFFHPWKKEIIKVEAPIPESFTKLV